MRVTNLNTHGSNGQSHVDLDGQVYGQRRDRRPAAIFVATGGGPEFATNIAIVNTNVTALNPLLQAHGRFDVAQGLFTL